MPQPSVTWHLYRRLVRTHVQFFVPPKAPPAADVLKLCNLSEPYPGVANLHCPTVLIDLTLPEETLWDAVNPKSRKVIRQAARENITVEQVQELSEGAWKAFRAAYDRLRSRKAKADPLGVGQIRELVEGGQFAMTISREPGGETLSWHTYILSHCRARLLNTVSAIDPARDTQWNNMVGRANRLHHWQDMLRFKREGIKSYDLGGVYRGTDDDEQVNIAKFKKSFGGVDADTFDAVLPLTVKGRVALSLIARIGAEARFGGT